MSAAPGDVAGALLEALLPGSGIGVAVHDEHLRVLVISPSLAELSGTRPGEQVGRRLTEVLPGEVGEVAEASLRAVAASRRPLLRLEPAVEAGRERGWLIHVYPLEYGGRELVAVIALDVTESRRAHEHLQQTRERLDTAQRMARVGSWSWDVTGDRWHWSEELFRIAGLPPTGPPPDFRSLLGAIPPEHRDAFRDITSQALRDGRPYEIRFPVLLPDGGRRILRGRGVPVRGDGGAVERIHGFAQDVTELARAESQQRAAAALGQLALSGVTLEVLMREAADAVASELGLDFVGVVAPVEDGAELEVRALSSGGTPFAGRTRGADRRGLAQRPRAAHRRDADRARLGARAPAPARAARRHARGPQQRGRDRGDARGAAGGALRALGGARPGRRGGRGVHGGGRERDRVGVAPARGPRRRSPPARRRAGAWWRWRSTRRTAPAAASRRRCTTARCRTCSRSGTTSSACARPARATRRT